MSPKVSTQYKEERKLEILKVALDVFYEKGFKSTTMHDIVIATGKSRGMVYQYFSKTEQMMIDILNSGTESFEKSINSLYQRHSSVWDMIEEILSQYTKESFNTKMNTVAYEFFIDYWRQSNPQNVNYAVERLNKIIEIYSSILQKGVETNEFHPKQPLKTIALFIINVTDGLISLSNFNNDNCDIQDQVEALRIYLRNVLF